jgi:hypothetical protein
VLEEKPYWEGKENMQRRYLGTNTISWGDPFVVTLPACFRAPDELMLKIVAELPSIQLT